MSTEDTSAAVPDEDDRAKARAACEHFYASHCSRRMSIRLCMMCHQPDWYDLERQLREASGSPVAPPVVGAEDDSARESSGFHAPAREGSGASLEKAVDLALAACVTWAREAGPAVWSCPSRGQVRAMVEAAASVLMTDPAARAIPCTYALEHRDDCPEIGRPEVGDAV